MNYTGVEIKLRKLSKLLILLILMSLNSYAQFGSKAVADLSGDTTEILSPQDSLDLAFLKPDSLNKDSLDQGPKLVMRNYDHKQQVVVGSVIMSCIAIMLVFLNNYNPRR